ncbi:MAG: sel1 repeat family protein [Betaproteobacteria bacterium]|jgi:TPR repeat protein|nr:MAG: sel1 repeat family protein [Betaproteobacteria bacterium]
MSVLRQFVLAFFLATTAMHAWAAAGDEEFDRGYDAFVSRDYAKAMQWWQQAAQKEHVRAQNGLGVLYRDGDLGEPDKKRAAYWFRRSAENGYVYAMYSLAMLYRDGDGVARDDVEAHKWFNLASALNFDPKAQFQRDLIARRMSPDAVAEAEKRAQEWLDAFFFGSSSI